MVDVGGANDIQLETEFVGFVTLVALVLRGNMRGMPSEMDSSVFASSLSRWTQSSVRSRDAMQSLVCLLGFAHHQGVMKIDLMRSQSCGVPNRIVGDSITQFLPGLQL